MKNYTLGSCQELIDKYVNTYKGEATTLREGVLGLGTVLLHGAEGKKTILIKEYYISAWCSGHSIRMYNVMPKKYKKLIGITV